MRVISALNFVFISYSQMSARPQTASGILSFFPARVPSCRILSIQWCLQKSPTPLEILLKTPELVQCWFRLLYSAYLPSNKFPVPLIPRRTASFSKRCNIFPCPSCVLIITNFYKHLSPFSWRWCRDYNPHGISIREHSCYFTMSHCLSYRWMLQTPNIRRPPQYHWTYKA